MSADRAFMLMIEPHEIKLLLDSLMLMREHDEDPRIMSLLRRIITHGRVPYCKRIAPDAYKLCFPDGPEYAEEMSGEVFKKGRAFMIMIEPGEPKVMIDSLMLMREHDIEVGQSEDHRIKPLLRHIMLHAGLPHSKSIAPDAYKLCFPEGPPRIVGTYGKYKPHVPDGPQRIVGTYGKYNQ